MARTIIVGQIYKLSLVEDPQILVHSGKVQQTADFLLERPAGAAGLAPEITF